MSTSSTATTSANLANLSKVILPIVRRVMPSIIATDIIGVQPMTGPTGQIFTLRNRYGKGKYRGKRDDRLKIPLQPGHFKVFLRLYNRRKFTLHEDILAANYPWVYINSYQAAQEAQDWCKERFGKCGYIFDMRFSRFYFENREDCAMFTLSWL